MKSSLLRQISSKMVQIKRKMYMERKEKERRFGVQKQAKREAETTEIVNPTLSRFGDCSE